MKPYSVLLLYPDYLSDDMSVNYPNTFYVFVEAETPREALHAACQKAMEGIESDIDDEDDFKTLLVVEGHHHDLKWS